MVWVLDKNPELEDAVDYATLKVRTRQGVAIVTLDNPPVNLLDQALITDLAAFRDDVADDDDVRVVVFDSADPDFFIAHGDMSAVRDPTVLAYLTEMDGPAPITALIDSYRALPKVTIGKVAGHARGAGSEFLLALDLRFAAAGAAWFGQPEVALGIFPGSGGTRYLPQAAGRARALEIILGAELFDAQTAERYGWINRALSPGELDAYVEHLAFRIASHPAQAVRLAKQSVDAADAKAEDQLIRQVFTSDQALRRMNAALDAGAQTRAGELNLEELIDLATRT
jgi:enoyl-CoA hydratase/carnithine racemase